ncbi:MFS transporter [Actinoplanes sp. CA-051413]|uniref:MFS transporter n=1 Tax=Actinoplanes sp. CA-051413 TaxID=3239899 RepID=UPI003D97D95A
MVTRADVGSSRRTLIGACVGNAVEWYDFAIFGAFSTVLAQVFFPNGSRAALAVTFAIFATSFIVRPLGATIVGRRSDRLGRRGALSSMIALMTVATAAIAVLPTWAMIGVLAPVLLLLLRLLQGFSAGGEVPSSVTFLLESAPPGRRGWYGGWHTASIAIGMATGYGIATLLTALCSGPALRDWGWRLAFLIAAPLGLVARFIRRRLDETRMFEAVVDPASPRVVRDVLRGRGRRIARGLVLVAALSVAFNLWFVFLPSHLAATGAMPLYQALGISILGLSSAAVTAPLAGRLSDRVGRRPVLVASTLALAGFAFPGFLLAGHSGLGLLVSDIVMGCVIGMLTVTAVIGELFPTSVRATGIAVTYGVATAVAGGTAPLVATLLAEAGAWWAVPAYLAGVAALALAAAGTARETAFDQLR